jgi:DegV family protein with EDD domain
MINILTDSTADLPEELCAAYQIETIPMYVQLNGQLFKDGDDISANQLFEKVGKTGQYPTTSAPSLGDFIQFFDRNDPIIYIGVSSALSATFQNAQLAVRELKDKPIELIDSLSFSTGYGQVVLQAAEWRNAGMDFDTISRRIRERIQKLRGVFILESLDYLYHGGRCSAVENFVSSALKIRPFLTIQRDGRLGVLRKVRGSRMKTVRALLSYFKEELLNNKIKRIFLTHLDCDAEVQFLIDEICKFDHSIEIITANVGCVLATHSGPKPLGVAYSIE